jgi:hypothetical protein
MFFIYTINGLLGMDNGKISMVDVPDMDFTGTLNKYNITNLNELYFIYKKIWNNLENRKKDLENLLEGCNNNSRKYVIADLQHNYYQFVNLDDELEEKINKIIDDKFLGIDDGSRLSSQDVINHMKMIKEEHPTHIENLEYYYGGSMAPKEINKTFNELHLEDIEKSKECHTSSDFFQLANGLNENFFLRKLYFYKFLKNIPFGPTKKNNYIKDIKKKIGIQKEIHEKFHISMEKLYPSKIKTLDEILNKLVNLNGNLNKLNDSKIEQNLDEILKKLVNLNNLQLNGLSMETPLAEILKKFYNVNKDIGWDPNIVIKLKEISKAFNNLNGNLKNLQELEKQNMETIEFNHKIAKLKKELHQ